MNRSLKQMDDRIKIASVSERSVSSRVGVGPHAPVILIALTTIAVVLQASAASPQRIISLVPNVTEMLFAIGAGPRVVGVSSFDHVPPAVDALPRVGALLDPNVEKILSLRPDLVVTYESQTDLRQQLERAQIAVFDYKHGGLADVARTLRALGTTTGDSARAEAVAAALEHRLDAVRARVAGRPRTRTLLVFGRDTDALRNVSASGSIGFLHDMLAAAGGENVVAEKRQSVQLSLEAILSLAPDAIVELRYSGEVSTPAVKKAAADWQALPSVPAVRTGRVYVLVGDEYVVPGPRIGQAAESLARLLHPEAFK